MSLPLVSIIIPTYNRGHLIGETLDSILAQTYTNWECIVVDDGSTDDTNILMAEYISKDCRFQYHLRPTERLSGGNAARNYGFEISKGDYIQWFDSDDVMLPTFLTLKMSAFKEGVDLVISFGTIVNSYLKKEGVLSFNNSLSLFKGFVLWQNQITTNCVLFKRQFLLFKTLFNPEILRGQESEFFSRIFFELSKNQYFILQKELFLYRQHETTKSVINKVYIPKFKFSQSYIYVENLKRSIIINDNELIENCAQTLLMYFNSSLLNKDFKTSKYIYTNLLFILRKNNLCFYIEFKIIGVLLLSLKSSSYKVYKRWKNMKVC